MTTIYDELLAAAGEEFLPQAEGEPDAHYIRRLVLIVCSCTDEKWETLSKAAQEWNNAQALRVKDHQDPEECPGFLSSLLSELKRTGTELKCPDYDIITKDFVTINWPIVTRSQVEAVKNGTSRLEDQDGNSIVDAVIDAGWPDKPSPQQIMDSVTTTLDEDLKKPMFHKGPIVDVPPQYVKMVDEIVNSKHTATDAVRAIVMQHQDWNQSQIAAELEAHNQPVSLGTIATVRSMTLATIAVAKGLGKWVE